MTGKQIAENLKGSKRKWGTGSLFAGGFYCVLGIKALEAGVRNTTLQEYDNSNDVKDYASFWALGHLVGMNDKAKSKKDLITKLLEKRNVRKNFAVEKFVAYLKGLEKKWQSEKNS
jgi:hypothetical protein